jgi:hypothetical protein
VDALFGLSMGPILPEARTDALITRSARVASVLCTHRVSLGDFNRSVAVSCHGLEPEDILGLCLYLRKSERGCFAQSMGNPTQHYN